jgi:cellulose synthase/poly-beta-1,6-N-acetylglucosamine synthase-like glycosyltransferase
MAWGNELVAERSDEQGGLELVEGAGVACSVDPELSARRRLSGPQAVVAIALVATLLSLLVTAAPTTLVVLVCCCCGFGVLTGAYHLTVAAIGAYSPERPVSAPPLPDGQLPGYTILAPLYKEAAAVGGLIRSLEALDYPRHLLDVKLIVRFNDFETLGALEAVRLGPQFELLLLDDGEPRTKPKACNFGLRHARGELVVIFDAEDRPEPDQLRKAAAALRAAPADVVCYQARLDFWNPATSSTTRYFTGEYSIVSEMFRPGLERLRAPIPLGGTSSHIPIRVLRELGAWDEFNVTEDADLGTRLARAGYRTRLLDSTTYEEAPSTVPSWIRQRSRWIKGWFQTWLVHTRHPLRLTRELGAQGVLHFQLTMLGSVSPMLFGPVVWMLAIIWLLSILGVVDPVLPAWLLAVGAGSLLFSTAAGIWMTVVGLRRAGHRTLVRSSLLSPVYELLKSAAAAKAVWQLITRPHYWEKTTHGLDDENATPTLHALSPEPSS